MYANVTRPDRSLTGLLLLAMAATFSGGCAQTYHFLHYNPVAELVHDHHKSYYHSPKTGRIIPKEHHQVCAVELPCFGYEPTCWHRWPEECGKCPLDGEVVSGPYHGQEVIVHEEIIGQGMPQQATPIEQPDPAVDQFDDSVPALDEPPLGEPEAIVPDASRLEGSAETDAYEPKVPTNESRRPTAPRFAETPQRTPPALSDLPVDLTPPAKSSRSTVADSEGQQVTVDSERIAQTEPAVELPKPVAVPSIMKSPATVASSDAELAREQAQSELAQSELPQPVKSQPEVTQNEVPEAQGAEIGTEVEIVTTIPASPIQRIAPLPGLGLAAGDPVPGNSVPASDQLVSDRPVPRSNQGSSRRIAPASPTVETPSLEAPVSEPTAEASIADVVATEIAAAPAASVEADQDAVPFVDVVDDSALSQAAEGKAAEALESVEQPSTQPEVAAVVNKPLPRFAIKPVLPPPTQATVAAPLQLKTAPPVSVRFVSEQTREPATDVVDRSSNSSLRFRR